MQRNLRRIEVNINGNVLALVQIRDKCQNKGDK